MLRYRQANVLSRRSPIPSSTAGSARDRLNSREHAVGPFPQYSGASLTPGRPRLIACPSEVDCRTAVLRKGLPFNSSVEAVRIIICLRRTRLHDDLNTPSQLGCVSRVRLVAESCPARPTHDQVLGLDFRHRDSLTPAQQAADWARRSEHGVVQPQRQCPSLLKRRSRLVPSYCADRAAVRSRQPRQEVFENLPRASSPFKTAAVRLDDRLFGSTIARADSSFTCGWQRRTADARPSDAPQSSKSAARPQRCASSAPLPVSFASS
jgi:hypothetical protein